MKLRTEPVIIRLFNTFFIGPCSLIGLSAVINMQWSQSIGLQKGWTVMIRGINREESVSMSRRGTKDPTCCFSIWFLACSRCQHSSWSTRPSNAWRDYVGWKWSPAKFAHLLCGWVTQSDSKPIASAVWAWRRGIGTLFQHWMLSNYNELCPGLREKVWGHLPRLKDTSATSKASHQAAGWMDADDEVGSGYKVWTVQFMRIRGELPQGKRNSVEQPDEYLLFYWKNSYRAWNMNCFMKITPALHYHVLQSAASCLGHLSPSFSSQAQERHWPPGAPNSTTVRSGVDTLVLSVLQICQLQFVAFTFNCIHLQQWSCPELSPKTCCALVFITCAQHDREMVGLVIGSGSRIYMLAHLSEGDKSDDMEVNVAKVPKHWEAIADTKATKGNFHC